MDVFATGAEPAKAITYTYKQGASDAVTQTWSDGDDKPNPLAGITLLDTDNLRVYVESKNEILYLPSEVACVGRLADLYKAGGDRYRGWIADNTLRYGAVFGSHFPQGTTAARLSARLLLTTPQNSLPSEQELRAAATWNPELEAELARLGVQLVQGPAAVATKYERIATACNSVVTAFTDNNAPLSDMIVELDGPALEARENKRQSASAWRLRPRAD